MKRNKAMHKLREFLLDRKVSSIDTLGVLSHSILRFVEDELGMLPPKHPTKRVNEISLLRPAYMWEDEDDKRD